MTDAQDKAGEWVAKPGYSEHQTGLAIDVNAEYGENSAVYEWLYQNSYKYGFILRYSDEKSHITGIIYESWHFRYVGQEAAEYIYEHNICFEEYVKEKLFPAVR